MQIEKIIVRAKDKVFTKSIDENLFLALFIILSNLEINKLNFENDNYILINFQF